MPNYSSNITPAQWQLIRPYFPRQKKRGRKKIHSTLTIVNAIFYVSQFQAVSATQ